MDHNISRRSMIKLSTGAMAGAILLQNPDKTKAEFVSTSRKTPKRVLRFAHMTDVHVKPEMGGGLGMAAALKHARSLEDPPELLITGGDAIMDALAQDEARTQELWDLWNSVLSDNWPLPAKHCIGNHDIWGWEKEKSNTTGEEPLWGKQWAMQRFGIDKPYYSFDKAGWHFVILDSTQVNPNPKAVYIAKLDEEQFEWLSKDLASVNPDTPILFVSHIPIVAVTPFFDEDFFKEGRTQIPGEFMHTDLHRIKDLFYQHKNIKLCLSGHMHLVDRVEYLDITYICGGAVCGAWWGGNWHECEEGYGIIDLYDDGSFAYQYVPYNWTPVG